MAACSSPAQCASRQRGFTCWPLEMGRAGRLPASPPERRVGLHSAANPQGPSWGLGQLIQGRGCAASGLGFSWESSTRSHITPAPWFGPAGSQGSGNSLTHCAASAASQSAQRREKGETDRKGIAQGSRAMGSPGRSAIPEGSRERTRIPLLRKPQSRDLD